MNADEIFNNSINPDTISVYEGRVIELDPNFEKNGYMYVDLVNPDSKDLIEGRKTSHRVTATFALRNCHNSWERPPEIKHKTHFMGSMNMTTSGDFHLRNYCFDMQTIQWFALVSTALNALGIVNVPPVMVSLDLTPFPGQAVSVNISQAVSEVAEEAIENALKEISYKDDKKEYETPTWEDVSGILHPEENTKIVPIKNNRKSLLRSNTDNDPKKDEAEIIATVISLITDPINSIMESVFTPYFKFVECIEILFKILEKNLDSIENLTIPITKFASSVSGTDIEETVNDKSNEIKNSIREKITKFTDVMKATIDPYIKIKGPSTAVEKALYEPLAMAITALHNQIMEAIAPVKKKLVELIKSYIQEPLNKLISFVSMGIQPIASALPNIIQMVVKYAIKKVLRVIIGKPIEVSLANILDPAEDIIEDTVKYIEGKVIELVVSTIKDQVEPLIRPIQDKIVSLIPTFGMDKLKDKLEAYYNDSEPLPEIYLGKDPLKPYVGFLEINWSDPEEIKAMLLTLIDLLPFSDDITNSIVKLSNKINKAKDWAVSHIEGDAAIAMDFISDNIPSNIKDEIYNGVSSAISEAVGVDVTNPDDLQRLVTSELTNLVGDLGPLQGVFDGIINGDGFGLNSLLDVSADSLSKLFTPDLFLDVAQSLDILDSTEISNLVNEDGEIKPGLKEEIEGFLKGYPGKDLETIKNTLENNFGIILSKEDTDTLNGLQGIYSNKSIKDIVTNSTSVLKQFTPQEFLPLFESKNPPVTYEAVLGEGLFKDYDPNNVNAKKPLKWITNGAYYVTDKEGNKYIVAGEEDVNIPIYYPESEEVGVITIPKGKINETKNDDKKIIYYVYETEEVDHIPHPGEDNPSEGTDLVPKLYYNNGNLQPKILVLQETVIKDNTEKYLGKIGDLLYSYVNIDGTVNKEIKGTYKELVTRCQQPIKQLDLYTGKEKEEEWGALEEDFKEFGVILNNNRSLECDSNGNPLIYLLKNTLLYKKLTQFDADGNYVYVTHTVNKQDKGNFEENSEAISVDVCSIAIEGFNLTVSDDRNTIEIQNIKDLDLPIYNPTKDPIFLPNYLKYKITYSESTLTSIKYYMLSVKEGEYEWLCCQEYPVSAPESTSDTIELKGCSIKFGIFDTTKITSYVQQVTDGFTELVAEDNSDSNAIMGILMDMLSHAIIALGQEGDFDAQTLIEILLKKVLGSVTGPLGGIIDKIMGIIQAFLDGYDGLRTFEGIQEELNNLVGNLNNLIDSAKPVLEATAKAATAEAVQSCSMSQAATGKDFGFSSGENYDLSTTTDAKLQLPYCKELKREYFLEPNCKVLVLAVGAGKQNLYAVDILT